jgi:hypothetical protein
MIRSFADSLTFFWILIPFPFPSVVGHNPDIEKDYLKPEGNKETNDALPIKRAGIRFQIVNTLYKYPSFLYHSAVLFNPSSIPIRG